MSGREEFLRQIRESLGRRDVDVAPPEPPYSVGPEVELAERASAVRELASRDAANLADVLCRVAEVAGWRVARVHDASEAGDHVLKLVRHIEARSAVHSMHPVVRSAISGDRFAEAGIALTPVSVGRESSSAEADRARLRSVMELADIGITGVDYAIAETGTCVIIARPGASRLASLLPPVHVALVELGQVLPSLDELFTLRRDDFRNGEVGSYMNLITGPSRSADIEYKLVTGVHGPGEVHLVLVG